MAPTRSLIPVFLVALTLVLSGCAARAPDASSRASAERPAPSGEAGITARTVPGTTYFYRKYEMPASAVEERIEPLAEEVALAAVRRARLDIVGPLTLVFPDFRDYGEQELEVAFGYPVRGHGNRLQNYHTERRDRFHCLSAVYDGESQDASELWRALYEAAARRGLEPSDENRVVVHEQGSGYRTEFQLGLRTSALR